MLDQAIIAFGRRSARFLVERANAVLRIGAGDRLQCFGVGFVGVGR